MPPDHEKSSFDLERPDKPTNKKHVVKNGVLRLVMWGGAFVFACLLIASTFNKSIFKKSKKIISPKRSRDGDTNLDIGGFEESTTQDDDNKAREREGLKLLQSSSADIISHPCDTLSKMLTNSIEDSEDENRPLTTTEPILENKEEESIVVIIYEEEEYDTNSEKSIENETQKYDEILKVAQTFPSRAFDEDDKNRPSTTSSSSSSSSSEETSSSGVLSQEIDGDDKNIDIVIHVDDGDENREDEHVQI